MALAILAVVLYLVTGGALFTERTTLYLYVPDATGVAPGSPVRVDGIDVGKVGEIGLSGSMNPKRVVRLTLSVERSSLAMIPTASYAELGIDSPVGDKFVDITSAGRGPIPPNSELPYKEPTDIFKTLDFAQFDANLRQMGDVLTEIETGRSRVGQFVIGTQMYTDLRGRVGDIETAIRNLGSTTSKVGQELYTDQLYKQLTAPVLALDRTLANLQSGQGTGGRMLMDPAQYDEFAAAVRSLRESIRDIRTGSFIQSDSLYADVGLWVASLTRTVEEFNAGPVFAAPQTYESLNGFARELEKTMKDFRGNPRKYMRLKVF